MTIQEIRDITDARVMCGAEHLGAEIDFAFGSDLMSDVLAFVKDSTVLITGMVNPQVVRTAEMCDILCIVISRGKQPTEEVIELAEEAGITILCTDMTTYTASGELYMHGLPGSKAK